MPTASARQTLTDGSPGPRCQSRVRWLLATAAALVVVLAPATPALAASPGTYSAPEWMPLRGDHLIGCAYLSPGTRCDGGSYHPNWAIDIKAGLGESLYAAGAGKVIEAVTDQGGNCSTRLYPTTPTRCPNGSRGNRVLIDHGSKVYSYYQHMRSVSVRVGDWVDENTVIGTVGDSGWSDPGFYHVHYERRSGTTINPVDPGPLKGCVGTALKSYPRDLTPAGAGASWQGLAGHRYTAHSDGSACAKTSGGGGGTGGKPKVDVVFAIDTTGSMGPYIAAVRASARAIAGALLASADARVALVDYKDLYSGCPGDGYASRVDLPFSTDAAAFSAAVDRLAATGGCDAPESVYSGIMSALALPWRNGATKAVLIMGDAPPHDPEPVTGYTRASVAAAAKAVDPAAIYSINIGGGGSPYFEDLAGDSDGRSYTASDPASAVEQITTAIGTITASAVIIDAGGPYTGAVCEPVTFTASVSGVEDTTGAQYGWDLDGDGSYEESTSLPTITHTFAGTYSGKVGVAVWLAENTTNTPNASATADAAILTATTTKYTGQRAGINGDDVHLQAFVYDPSKLPLAGISVTLTLGDETTCTATTDRDGKAVCRVVVSQPAGKSFVSATADPTERYFRSADGAPFQVQH